MSVPERSLRCGSQCSGNTFTIDINDNPRRVFGSEEYRSKASKLGRSFRKSSINLCNPTADVRFPGYYRRIVDMSVRTASRAVFVMAIRRSKKARCQYIERYM